MEEAAWAGHTAHHPVAHVVRLAVGVADALAVAADHDRHHGDVHDPLAVKGRGAVLVIVAPACEYRYCMS
jgi:hypothetical protein